LKRLMEIKAPEVILKRKRMLQESVDSFLTIHVKLLLLKQNQTDH
jgi:DNA-directed RNA polymerase beta' subunit